jgi:hypothetical protein
MILQKISKTLERMFRSNAPTIQEGHMGEGENEGIVKNRSEIAAKKRIAAQEREEEERPRRAAADYLKARSEYLRNQALNDKLETQYFALTSKAEQLGVNFFSRLTANDFVVSTGGIRNPREPLDRWEWNYPDFS